LKKIKDVIILEKRYLSIQKLDGLLEEKMIPMLKKLYII
jgi:hypothetical protein